MGGRMDSYCLRYWFKTSGVSQVKAAFVHTGLGETRRGRPLEIGKGQF